MIDHGWRERLAIADRLFSVGPGHKRVFVLARSGEGLRRSLIDSINALRDLLRRR